VIIADTCLVFHLFNETLLTASAQKILARDPYWVLPPLWREEYANVLSKLARKKDRAIDDIIYHFNYTLEKLKNCEISVDTKKALQVSIEYKISVYDAHFVALAIDLNTLLVTEDKEILKNCTNLALSIQNFLKKKDE
jgi:predicted nucleic acid-binding protein